MVPNNKKTLILGCQMANPALNHVVECGVWTGISMRLIMEVLPNKQYFGFDTFTGLPEDWVGRRGKVIAQKGEFDTGGVVPSIDGVKFYKGLFKDTIPQYLEIAEPIALLHVDCDLYSSTKDVLYLLNARIVPSTIIVFDEWFYMHSDGAYKYNGEEQKAYHEWVRDCQRQCQITPPNLPGRKMQMIVKVLV